MSVRTRFLTKSKNEPITSKDVMDYIHPDLVDLQNSVTTNTSAVNPTWTDYTSSSTIVGWTNPTKSIKYIVMGKMLYVIYSISGTSNATSASFTLPYTAKMTQTFSVPLTEDNQVFQDYPGYSRILINTSLVEFFLTPNNFTWTAAGVKKVQGQFFMEIN